DTNNAQSTIFAHEQQLASPTCASIQLPPPVIKLPGFSQLLHTIAHSRGGDLDSHSFPRPHSYHERRAYSAYASNAMRGSPYEGMRRGFSQGGMDGRYHSGDRSMYKPQSYFA
ncbi:hypothetical protein HDU98_001474, partial [Podochytrium sp. JEL0797]